MERTNASPLPPDAERATALGTGKASMGGNPFRPFRRFGVFAIALCLVFIWPLIQWVSLALEVDLHSYVLLIPVICGYLVWIERKELPSVGTPAKGVASVLFIIGALVLVAEWMFSRNAGEGRGSDHVTMMMLAFYFLFLAGCAWFWGRALMWSLIFHLGMLIFIVPLPGCFVSGLESFLQHASADCAHLFFIVSGTPVYRQGLVFALPTLTIEVARECSGIRSSLVLVITGLLASHLYLRTGWKKVFLVIATFIFGIARNAFRIFVLSMLTIHWDPGIMHSPLHKRGGPLFFALSLLPLFGLLLVLRKSDSRKTAKISNET